MAMVIISADVSAIHNVINYCSNKEKMGEF